MQHPPAFSRPPYLALYKVRWCRTHQYVTIHLTLGTWLFITPEPKIRWCSTTYTTPSTSLLTLGSSLSQSPRSGGAAPTYTHPPHSRHWALYYWCSTRLHFPIPLTLDTWLLITAETRSAGVHLLLLSHPPHSWLGSLLLQSLQFPIHLSQAAYLLS